VNGCLVFEGSLNWKVACGTFLCNMWRMWNENKYGPHGHSLEGNICHLPFVRLGLWGHETTSLPELLLLSSTKQNLKTRLCYKEPSRYLPLFLWICKLQLKSYQQSPAKFRRNRKPYIELQQQGRNSLVNLQETDGLPNANPTPIPKGK
jgi:hypothetical protein